MKSSTYDFHAKTKILTGSRICISIPLKLTTETLGKGVPLKLTTETLGQGVKYV